MRTRALFLLLILIGCGAATAFRSGVTGYTRPTEAWLEDQVPAEIGDFTFTPSADNPKVSYKMDERTYKVLDPIGIVARTYSNGKETYDVVVIMGDHPDALHDPEWCFTNQGWQVLKRRHLGVVLPSGTDVKVTALTLSKAGQNPLTEALFVFRGPSGAYHADHLPLWQDFAISEFSTGRVQKATFYRFIAASATTREDDLVRFATAFLHATSTLTNLAESPGARSQ